MLFDSFGHPHAMQDEPARQCGNGKVLESLAFERRKSKWRQDG